MAVSKSRHSLITPEIIDHHEAAVVAVLAQCFDLRWTETDAARFDHVEKRIIE